MRIGFQYRAAACLLALCLSAPGLAQQNIDRIDPAVVAPDLTEREAEIRPRTVPEISIQGVEPRVAPSAVIVAGAIRVEGAHTMQPADFATAILPWLGRELDGEALRALATAVADVARARGYVFARASIPEQALANGVLRVRLDEGRVDAIEIEGQDLGGIARQLARLADGRPVTRASLEAALLQAEDVPGVSLGTVRLRRNGRNVLVVPVRFDAARGTAEIDNRGTERIGPVRARVGVDFAGLALDGDQLSLEGAVTPLDPRELRVGAARYAIRPGNLEVALSGYYAATRAFSQSRNRLVMGESYEVALDFSQALVRRKVGALWLNGGFAVRRSMQETGSDLLRRDRVSVATLGLSGNAALGGGRVRGSAVTAIGLNLFDPTPIGDRDSSRRDASGRYVSWTGRLGWARTLDRDFTLRVNTVGQLSTKPLLVGEKLGLGGARFLRGYDYGERLGDEGAAGAIELGWTLPKPKVVKRLEVFAFADGGVVSDKSRSGSDSLASAGGGLRIGLPHRINAAAEIAVPLTGPRDEGNTRRPRLSFSLSTLF